MKKNSGIALIEIILSIGVLAVVSLIVVQMFTLSSHVQQRAVNTDTASLLAQSAIEAFRLNGIAPSSTFYGSDWTAAEKDNAAFIMVTEITQADKPDIQNISVSLYEVEAYFETTDNAESIFELSAAVWQGGSR